MLLNYDFLEFENDKKVRVIDDKLHVGIISAFRPFKGSFTKDFTDEE